MKLTKFTNLLVIGLVLSFAATGCKKKPTPLTTLPKTGIPVGQPSPDRPVGNPLTRNDDGLSGRNVPLSPDQNPNANGGGIKPSTGEPSVLPSPEAWANASQDAEIFKAYTVYFDFDSSAVRTSEHSKLGAVADYLKSNPAKGLRVEGNCDERGTEEYNRALGERRALALREELIRLGVNADHILTVSYGKDKPAVEGHDEAAWSKNRRGDFVLLTLQAAP